MQKARIEAEVARLRRLRVAHCDDQHAITQQIFQAQETVRHSMARISQIEADLNLRTPTRGTPSGAVSCRYGSGMEDVS